ncbi:NAD-dependent epimerase/dehydratase family protein [Bacillus sp. Xin]|uniref:NAD-dependent epimerase/dehydratase family protein n=1 Tax=unclassified Bacillus (in: firmicutes) TaxID=185979 RepID=UPI0015741B1E|nr:MULTISPECIES: NAD-dependent epimerase/dehydratase family protein [unclassified Bacillus (in: firmicutes)]MBC6976166.1 NAD-dependent epimerase/dehydratase family protein [Bacillus sp. Xin]MCI0766032.1 NAD-dependent epimerase/dehydratase family protein [Bacillus sp. TL12]NSW37348.1 NAD-dependent epimerase/dehydratase family protein [Bacillus sp. Xin1]
MEKVLVTGGFGFIGSHIVEKLVHHNYEVAVYDNLSTGSINNVHSKGIAFFDSVEDEGALEKAIETFKPDFVIHQAAQISVQNSVSNITNDARINIIGSTNIIKLSQKYGVKKIIFASSAAVYGNSKIMPIPVSHPTRPLSPYGVSKQTAEEYLKLAKELYDIDYVILRYSNVYGPRQTVSGEGGVISIFINHVMQEEQSVIYGDGLQTRDFIYVDDVASANLQALKYNGSGTFNISSSTCTSINEVFSMIQSIGKQNVSPIYQPAKDGDLKESLLCNKKSIQKLDWQPIYSLEKGLANTYDYYLKQKDPILSSGKEPTSVLK